jgi:putative (di)nucleoside polyphosphate hydrolase
MSETFRLGVGAVISTDEGRVLALERADIPGSWQLPQGGVEENESLLVAVYREVEEETGLERGHLELLAEHPVFLGYELPPESRGPKTGRGQCHRWFLFRLRAAAELGPPPGAEFRQHRWVLMDELVADAVPFRQSVYRELARYFAPHLPGQTPRST